MIDILLDKRLKRDPLFYIICQRVSIFDGPWFNSIFFNESFPCGIDDVLIAPLTPDKIAAFVRHTEDRFDPRRCLCDNTYRPRGGNCSRLHWMGEAMLIGPYSGVGSGAGIFLKPFC